MSKSKNKGVELNKKDAVGIGDDGQELERVCVGVNWGSIKAKGFLSRVFGGFESVDLDTSAAMFGADGELFDTVYYKHLRSKDKSIRHSGDDLTGDVGFDDDIDNEVIDIKLNKVDDSVKYIVFFLNSFRKHHFGEIPYSKIRIFEGKPHKPQNIIATFNLSVEEAFEGKVSMVMAKLTKLEQGSWRFSAIGEPVDAQGVEETVEMIKRSYLD